MPNPVPHDPQSGAFTFETLRRQCCWLNEHARIVTSQHGEDGIIEKIFEILPARDRYCVELGAWDGKFLSNTWNLVHNHGYTGILIEGDPVKAEELRKSYADCERVKPVCAFVSHTGEQSLDAILARMGVPRDFDLISIDVDGNDYHVWDSLRQFRPKVVIVEYNGAIPNHIDFVQEPDPARQQGCSIKALARLGKTKGYELVSVIGCNGIFVDARFYPLFHIPDNSIEVMGIPYSRNILFFTPEGTVVLFGEKELPWHGLQIYQEQFQVLPRRLRKNQERYSKLDWFIWRCLRKYRKWRYGRR